MGLACPGPRGAQRHRVIEGQADLADQPVLVLEVEDGLVPPDIPAPLEGPVEDPAAVLALVVRLLVLLLRSADDADAARAAAADVKQVRSKTLKKREKQQYKKELDGPADQADRNSTAGASVIKCLPHRDDHCHEHPYRGHQ